MAREPSQAIKLFGTEEPAPPARSLKAGALVAEFEAGNLRHIRFDGVEALRAISFIVRDRDWGTYIPTISDLKIEETDTGFTVSYSAVARDEAQEFRYHARIQGEANGHIAFHSSGEAASDFLTNRTGFVVLHPIAGVAGHPVRIEHVDGCIVDGRFPGLIDPVQPMMDLRELTHEAAPGLRATCRMEGDTFEMEDQRNWTDASYKTYVRPLALPWPYTLKAGARLEQSITLTISGKASAHAADRSGVSVALGEPLAKAPDIGVGLDLGDAKATREVLSSVRELRPRHLICYFDPRHGRAAEELQDAVAIAKSLGATPWLEAVVTEVADFEREVRSLAAVVSSMGSPFDVVMLSPAADLKCTLPGSVWPPAAPADDLFRIAREAFPGVRLGGGMFSYFTELNRKRPPLQRLDFVTFTTSALVHAGDDVSVMEGLESLPAIAASARAIAGGLPFSVGPSGMGMRMNPYGPAPKENPGNNRQAMNHNDPRQRGLLGAAWTLGYYAHFARGGASAVAFGGVTGALGVVHSPQAWPQPWFDEAGGLFPVFHVLRGLSGFSGCDVAALDVSAPSVVQGLAFTQGNSREIWIANLTALRQDVALPARAAGIALLNEATFVEATRSPDHLDQLAPMDATELELSPFAVARIRLA